MLCKLLASRFSYVFKGVGLLLCPDYHVLTDTHLRRLAPIYDTLGMVVHSAQWGLHLRSHNKAAKEPLFMFSHLGQLAGYETKPIRWVIVDEFSSITAQQWAFISALPQGPVLLAGSRFLDKDGVCHADEWYPHGVSHLRRVVATTLDNPHLSASDGFRIGATFKTPGFDVPPPPRLAPVKS